MRQESGGFSRLRIITENPPYVKKPRIVADFRASQYSLHHRDNDQVNFEVSRTRLIQLAREILKHYEATVKYEEWTPTFQDLERRLEERFARDGFFGWVCDYARLHPEEAQRIRDWLNDWPSLDEEASRK